MLRQLITLSITSLFWATQASIFFQAAHASSETIKPFRATEPRSPHSQESSSGIVHEFQLNDRQLFQLNDRQLFQLNDRQLNDRQLNNRQPENSQFSDEFDTYRLGTGDSLLVNVFRFPDLSFQTTIDPAGNLLVPLAGAVSVEGLTLAEAKAKIQTALDRFVIQPQIDVILIGQRPVSVTIVGEVTRPGFYPLQSPQLTTALITAGGATGQADLRAIRIQRPMPDGSVRDREIDLYTPFAEAQTLPDLRLNDGDTIVIPSLTIDNGYDRMLIARSTLAQQQIRVRVMNYAAGSGGAIGSLTLPNGSRFIDALTTLSIDLNSADIRNIALVRFDEQQEKAVSQELDGKQALLGDPTQDPMLENNDVIVIGRNWVARITYALNTFTQPFRDVLGFLLFFQSLGNSAANLFGPAGRSGD